MTFDEAKALLASITVLDNRKVDSTSIQMWQTILDPYTFSECMWALREFARTNVHDYLRPAHLVDIIHRQRINYAMTHPMRMGGQGSVDEWLKFEAEIEQLRRENKEIRDSGARLAVEAMEDEEKEEDKS